MTLVQFGALALPAIAAAMFILVGRIMGQRDRKAYALYQERQAASRKRAETSLSRP